MFPPSFKPRSWDDPTAGFDATAFGDVEFQVIGTPGTAYVPQRSLDGTNYVPCNVYDKDGNPVTSIAAAGIYSLDGGGWFKLTGGAGSTFSIRAGF